MTPSEINERVAVEVFKLTLDPPAHWENKKGRVVFYKPPSYSTDIDQAWKVVEKMREDPRLLAPFGRALYTLIPAIGPNDGVGYVLGMAMDALTPEIICFAALKAVER